MSRDLCPIIAALPFVEDGDLRLCRQHGIAYQADRAEVVEYDAAYFDKYVAYEGQPVGDALNAGRVAFVDRHFGSGRLLDVGIGSGDFIKHRPNTFGTDVNATAVVWLQSHGLLGSVGDGFSAFSFWDVLEHVPDPTEYLDHVPLHGFVFVSIPIFESLETIRQSKHYRPGEHLQYFTRGGFWWWMEAHGFQLLEVNDFESAAGRSNIVSFVFRRVLCPKTSS